MVKQGRMQKSRPAVGEAQTRGVTSAVRSRHRGRNEPLAEGSQDLSTKPKGKIRGRSTPDLHYVFCLADTPVRSLCFLWEENRGGVQTPGWFLCQGPKPDSPKSGFLLLTPMTPGSTETNIQIVVIKPLCFNFHSKKLPLFIEW